MRRRTWNSWTMFDNADGSGNKTKAASSQHDGPVASPVSNKGTDPDCSYQRTMAEALERAMDLAEVRMERVARVRDSIITGQYDVASLILARKIMETMLKEFH